MINPRPLMSGPWTTSTSPGLQLDFRSLAGTLAPRMRSSGQRPRSTPRRDFFSLVLVGGRVSATLTRRLPSVQVEPPVGFAQFGIIGRISYRG